MSAPIYSSVSGTVAKIDTAIDATGYRKPAIIVKVEGDEWEPGIDRTDTLETLAAHPELTAEAIVEQIKWAGVTGMGGAGFPTFIKLCPPPTAKAECVILNGVECEPYITSDYRLMMEHADEILVGLDLLMKAAHVERGYIGVEANKPKAIALLQEKTAADPRVQVVPLQMKYPQGGEKQLVDAVIGRQVPAPPAIPVNVGAIVQNVATSYAALYYRVGTGSEPVGQLPGTHGNSLCQLGRAMWRHAGRRQQGSGWRAHDGQGRGVFRRSRVQGHQCGDRAERCRCPPRTGESLHTLWQVC